MSLLNVQTARVNSLAAPLGSNLFSLVVRAKCREKIKITGVLYDP